MGANLRPIWAPYCGAAPAPADWLTRWNGDPIVIAGLIILAFGWRRFAGPLEPYRLAGAMALLALLFITPFCALTSALFSARVVHHVVLALVVPPLLVWSASPGRLRPGGSIGAWTALQAAIFWLWHAPPVYTAALSSDLVYWLMQASLLAAAIGFWSAVRQSREPAAVASLLLSMVQMGLLGALITFAATPLYAPHFMTTTAWGLTPLEDQQLAGLIMWVPAAAVYLGIALVLVGRVVGRNSDEVSS